MSTYFGDPTPVSPYIVMVSGDAMSTSKLAVIETDGVNLPRKISLLYCLEITQVWRRKHQGSTPKCGYHRAMKEAVELRDKLNEAHAFCLQVKAGKASITLEMMQRAHPAVKQKLASAAISGAVARM